MRVIAGEFKGRRLVGPDTDDTRPIMDRAKESIFNSIAFEIPDARVVDLFAGAGSFGIEALSRGAKSAVFVESGRRALQALRTNLDALGIEGLVRTADVLTWDASVDGPFDVVFCDPPWPMQAAVVSEVLERLAPDLTEDALVVVTRRSTDPTPEPDGYRIDDERRLGGTRIIRYRKETS
ncbi:MAG: 16S rRNA (guanine(966)-N(2))-methyltransferase RsmD [Acidimicrobiia bacterium]